MSLSELFRGRKRKSPAKKSSPAKSSPAKQRASRSSGRTRSGRGKSGRGTLGGQVAPWLLAAAGVLVIVGVGVLKWSRSQQGQASLLAMGSDRMYTEVQEDVEAALSPVLPGLTAGPVGVGAAAARAGDVDWPVPEFAAGAALRCRLVEVASDLPFRVLEQRLAQRLAGVGAKILWAERLYDPVDEQAALGPDEAGDLLRLDVGVKGRPTHTLVLRHRGNSAAVRWGNTPAEEAWQALAARVDGPVVALVIDDWGQNRKAAARQILELPVPLTMAVLPGLPHSREFALAKTDLVLPPEQLRGAAARGQRGARGRSRRLAAGCFLDVGLAGGGGGDLLRRREVLLPMPMEPRGYPATNPGPQAILVGMNSGEVQARLEGALRGLEKVTGVNNHMGSAATSDQQTMDHFMSALAEKELLFLDSLTSSSSVAYATAQRHGVPALKNRIFLDADHEDEQKVQANLEALVRVARAGGSAVGIGHPHPATARVLAREVPRLVAQGVTFVTVSELHALQGLRQKALP